MSARLTIGSLFSGIGGLELGLERGLRNGGVQVDTVWQVERDNYCVEVLAKHWPGAMRYHDVCHVGASNLITPDIICGGFPCQDISYAGKGAGLSGARSGLWYEYARIIRELGPRYVVVENVAALLTRGLGDVLGTLADIGYDAEWSRVSASDVGAPHRRDRIFILAYAQRGQGVERYEPSVQRGWTRQAEQTGVGGSGEASDANRRRLQIGTELDGESQDGAADRHSSRRHADRLGDEAPVEVLDNALRGRHRIPQGEVRTGRDAAFDASWWATEPDVGRVAHGVPARVDRLRALGNAVVPQVAEVVGRLIAEREAALERAA